jgi:hypothetical protein
MRFLLAPLLAATLALPVLAQPPRDGGERERPAERPMDRPMPSPDVEKLMNRVRELEKQLAEAKGKKDEKNEKKREDRKPPEVQPQPFPPREGQPPQFGGRGPGDGGNPFNSNPREGQPRPMGGISGMGGGGGFGMMMSGGPGGGGMGMFPGMEALTKEEQEVFQKLVSKMRGAQQKPGKPNVEERLERLENMMQKLDR